MSSEREMNCSVTLLTPAGRAAVATVSVWGPQASGLIAACFQAKGKCALEELPVGAVRFGLWHDRGETKEDVVVCRVGPTDWEIHGHGGHAAPARIIHSLASRGARLTNAASWLTRRPQAATCVEAQLALPEAHTEKTAAILLDQARGALDRRVDEIIAMLDGRDLPAALSAVVRLRDLCPLGLHLTRPWKIAVAGEPNVGKSRLVNRLLGYERSIVTELPGTTRDILTGWTAFDGWPIELHDTAGLRATHDPIESEGIRRALEQIQAADLTLVVHDALAEADVTAMSMIPEHCPRLVVTNKIDLCSHCGPAFHTHAVSALTGDRVPELIETMLSRLVGERPPASGEAVPFCPRHVRAIEQCTSAIAAGNRQAAATAIGDLKQPARLEDPDVDRPGS